MRTPSNAVPVADTFADAARVALADESIPKSEAERQFLKDVMRGRYQFTAETRLVALCARSLDAAIRLAPSEALRSLALRDEDVPPLDLCDEGETDAQCDEDKAAARYRREPHSLSARHALHDAALREAEWARRVADRALLGT